MKFAFFGTAPFAVPALERLAPHIELVVSQPDRPTGRGLKTQMSPVKAKALELGLPVETPERCRTPEYVERLQQLEVDAFIVAAYGQILPQRILDIPPRGCINLHGSILPRWRGAAPVQRCIEAGDTVSGVTLMQMDKGMDTGDIIAIEETPIGESEVAGELYYRLSILAADMIEEWAPRIASGDYQSTPQDNDLATMAPKVTKSDSLLNFEQSAAEAYRNFRAFTPAPGAWIETNLGTLKIHEINPIDGSGTVGQVLAVRPNLVVAFAEGALNLVQVQPEGRKRLSGADFANGARIEVGDCLLPTKR
ncbi:MAG: methionyl-tRNA formyltransferase [Armatimonadetes bacterium]|nr:methionyl-tRNA formyltransferase [Armatimonadota bacterium]